MLQKCIGKLAILLGIVFVTRLATVEEQYDLTCSLYLK